MLTCLITDHLNLHLLVFADYLPKLNGRKQVFKDIHFFHRKSFTIKFDKMKLRGGSLYKWKEKDWLLYNRWAWHLIFWLGYCLFRLWPYYLTVRFKGNAFLEYMLLAEIMFVAITYYTLWLYRRFFQYEKYITYFLLGSVSWILYLFGRTGFQVFYLRGENNFQGELLEIFLSNLTFVLLYFLFITACKYFKDGYISRHLEAVKKEQHLMAEVNNLKAQIAPHFLFNTLNNLYGLAVDKSDKLPELMLRLSDLLRHSLYETQKTLVPLNDEVTVLKSYIQLEALRLEDDLILKCDNNVPPNSDYLIAPAMLLLFIENAFKHAKLVQSEPVQIFMHNSLKNDWFTASIKNNYNKDHPRSATGIGLINVQRRLEVLYPGPLHKLEISSDEKFYSVKLILRLQKK